MLLFVVDTQAVVVVVEVLLLLTMMLLLMLLHLYLLLSSLAQVVFHYHLFDSVHAVVPLFLFVLTRSHIALKNGMI